MCTGASFAADVHPIVEVQSGYLFGSISEEKWIKADEAAKLIGDETGYRIYGLTQALGDAKGDRPKVVEDVCTDTLSFPFRILERHDYYEKLTASSGSIQGFDRLYEITASFNDDGTTNTSWKLSGDR